MHGNELDPRGTCPFKETNNRLLGDIEGIKSKANIYTALTVGSGTRQFLELVNEPVWKHLPVKGQWLPARNARDRCVAKDRADT